MPVSLSTELRLAYFRAAVEAQTEEESDINDYRLFYYGEQGVELTDRQKEYLGGFAAKIGKQALANICKRTVHIPLERLAVDEIAPGDNTTQSSAYAEAVRVWWENQQLVSAQGDLYLAALRDKCGAIVVGWDQEANEPTFTVNELWDGSDGSLRLHLSRDTGELMYASKRWVVHDPEKQGQTGKLRLTMYHPNSIWRFEETVAGTNDWRLLRPDEIEGALNPQPWTLDGTLEGEPIGLPVIPFWNPIGSELDDVLMPQRATNKTLADLLSSTDLHGFPIITVAGEISTRIDPVTGEPEQPKIDPGRMLIATDPQTKINRIQPADLRSVFEYGVLAWIRIITLIKGWPMYLFDRSANPPSGEALRHMESSLVSQVESKQLAFTPSWVEVFNVAARASAAFAKKSYEGKLKMTWRPASLPDRKLDAETDKIRWESAEVPRRQRLRESNYTEEEIDTMLREEQEDEARVASDALETALQRAKILEGKATDDQDTEE